MAKIKNSISTLIETQLPEFISTEYELFGKFLTKYYESLEVQGGTLDIANNLQTYADIGYYESNILNENTELDGNLTDVATTITVVDATSFPKENGYIKIGKEICFYKSRNTTQFLEVSRGVSGNTRLGDLYNKTEFVTSQASSHSGGELVQNVSNMFLYALVKNFEKQYLASFPEKYLKDAVDKRSLIKNIGQFYRSKGTEKSIQFLFNTVIAGGQENKPTVYNPSDFTYKSSTSDWTQGYGLRVKVLSGNVEDLVGKVIVQEAGERNGYASATVDNVRFDSKVDDENTYNLFLATETINGIFEFTSKTTLTKQINSLDDAGDRINVDSTLGWDNKGSILVGSEVITFDDKNITQFTISSRQTNAIYPAGTEIYDPIYVGNSDVQLLVFGLVYNLSPIESAPYSTPNDSIEVTKPGFESFDPKIVDDNGVRWLLSNPNGIPTSPTNPSFTSNLTNLSTDISAIFSDEQFYYVASSGFPSYSILENVTSIPGPLADQKILKLIRKEAISTTEVYKTGNRDVGLFLNGVRAYSHKDTTEVRFGKLENIAVQNQGRNYRNAPYVLVNGVSGRAVAKLSGQFVESVEILNQGLYGKTPTVEIVSGRNALVSATVTFGRVTDLIINDPGEYYSTPPVVIITDLAGQGRLAEYTAEISDGKITGFVEVNQGDFYSQENVRVTISPIGSGAVANAELTKWTRNRYSVLDGKLDDDNGYAFLNFNNALEYGYAHIANPKNLRILLQDNLDTQGNLASTKTHSPILGFAYDGNPIYGPYAHEDPLDSGSSIVRMTTSYIRKTGRNFGPSTADYPLGSFIEDYQYTHKSGSLDENNGRYCVTPDYPHGTYAYFISVSATEAPEFPYLMGDNYYSLPVESNYKSTLNQENISKNAKRLYVPGISQNGGGVLGFIQDLESGSVDAIEVDNNGVNANSFGVGSSLVFDNQGTEGFGVESIVSSVFGKQINYLESFEQKAVKLVITRDSYVFADDFLRQPSTGAFGTIVGTVRGDNTILLRDVNGTFDKTATFSTDIKVVRLTIDKVSTYKQGSILSLTDGIVTTNATGEVLESVTSGNTVILKVLTGTFEDQTQLPGYFLKSDSLEDTSGAVVDDVEYLSDDLRPFNIDDNIALVETDGAHNLGIGDVVNIEINPNDVKTRTYQVRKRIYQELLLRTPEFNTKVDYSGIGRGIILNAGSFYEVGTFTNVDLTGGAGSGAKANIVVSPLQAGDVTGYVSEVQITDGGTGYRRGDILGVADGDLNKVGGGTTPQTLKFFIDHVGVSAEATIIKVDSAAEYADDDLLMVDSEIVKIVSINDKSITVERGQEGTEAVDHYDNAPVSLHDAGYNFNANYSLNGSESVIYNKAEQTLLVIYPSTQSLDTLQPITEQTSFFDDSNPKRFANIITVTAPENRFEFRLDPSLSIFSTNAPNDYTSDWNVNPIIEVQEYYKYRFDTSDNSLTGSHLDFSPSGSYNIIPIEKVESPIAHGSPNSFVEMKFGYGARIASNNYNSRVPSRFSNYFYFDRNGKIANNKSYLKVINDPLAGRQVINYVTSNRFSYSLKSNPQWDGSGSIKYTTTGQFAVGLINSVDVSNIGFNYKKPPIVLGAYPSTEHQAAATVSYDPILKSISAVTVTAEGSNYKKPKVVITEGDGINAEFSITSRDGKVLDIKITNQGKDYSKAPKIAIIESDTNLYAVGNKIGRPKNVKLVTNGSSFHKDKSLLSEYSSNFTFALTNYGDKKYLLGEIVTQTINGTVVARGTVKEWRDRSNLLKVAKIQGTFRENYTVEGSISKAAGTIKKTYVTIFEPELRPYSDNTGNFTSDRGRIGNANQRILDSFFYQDYSYVIKSRTPTDVWRDLVKQTTHPAGFKVFGEVILDPKVEAPDGIEMPSEMPKASHFTIVQLWDPNKNKITVENTRRTLTQTIITTDDYRAIKGTGSVDVSEFNFNETLSQTLSLKETIDGIRGTDLPQGTGAVIGRKTFTLESSANVAVNPYSAENLIVTIDGVIQEPLVAYTVSGNQITFAEAPLGAAVVEGQEVPEQSIFIRQIEFKDNASNDKHFRKIRNFYQRGGTWIDSANQILLNQNFIIAESIGWFETEFASDITNGNIPWTAIESKVTADCRILLEALESDLRFGGNTKTLAVADDAKEKYDTYKNQINALFQYIIRLSKLAMRNWDWIAIGASYTAGADIITVSDTSNIALGAAVSSGSAFPLGSNIRVTEIISSTKVRVSATALVDSSTAPAGSAGPGVTYLNGSSNTSVTLPTGTGAVIPPNTYAQGPGTSLTVNPVFSGLDQVIFTFSGVNSGKFYIASELIQKNRAYIIDSAINWAKIQFPGLQWGLNETKCRRDTGLLVDAAVECLRFGGNRKIVELSELYFIGSQLSYINAEFEETKKTFKHVLTELCVKAMRQTLPGTSQYTNIAPVLDNDVIIDSVSPACADVESSLNTYYDIIETILNTGPSVIQITEANPTRPGYFTNLVPSVNYAILPDPQLPSAECEVVASALEVYGDVLESRIVDNTSVTASLPDYIDGVTKDFELYWDDNGTAVALTESDEHLIVALNGVIQRPKYNADEPAFDSYFIDKSVVPNMIRFTAPPIWDQDLGAKTIQEPSMVEKFFATNVGNYKRYSIDQALVNGVRKGPHLILDIEDNKVVDISDSDYVIVIMNGVIQRPISAYEINGTSITFKYPPRKEDVIDIRLCYGRDLAPTLTFHDFDVNGYLYDQTLDIVGTNEGVNFNNFVVNSDYSLTTYEKLYIYQEDNNGKKFAVGKAYDWKVTTNDSLFLKIYTNNIEFDQTKATYAVTLGANSVAMHTFGSAAFTLTKNGDYLQRIDKSYFDNDVKKSNDLLQRKGFFRLAPGDKIKVDGESKYRTIKTVPGIVQSRDFRLDGDGGNDIYGAFIVTPYNGKTNGEGLSVEAVIENGSVTSLKWNERIIEEITEDGKTYYKFYRPTAFGYYTPPILQFIPEDGNGGGARASVVVAGGEIQGVELTSGGSGYTKAPKVAITRKYDIIKRDDVKIALVKLGVQSIVSSGLSIIGTVDTITLPPPEQAFLSSIFLNSITDTKDEIEQEIMPPMIEDGAASMPGEGLTSIPPDIYIEPQVIEVDAPVDTDIVVVSTVATGVQNIQSSTLLETSRQLTQTIQREIYNTLIDNVVYRNTGAYLQAPLNIGDTILYIADTDQFTSYGKLMVGDEVVYYPRKRADRFLNITRGFEGTTEKNWAPGQFVRQIEDLVSVAFGGVASFTSEVVVKNSIPTGISERKTQQQFIAPATFDKKSYREHLTQVQIEQNIESISSVSKQVTLDVPAGDTNIVSDFTNFGTSDILFVSEIETVSPKVTLTASTVKREIVFYAPPGGVVDYFQESVFFTNPIETRNNGFVTLVTRDVTLRDGSTTPIRNILREEQATYVGQYTVGNLGANIGSWDYVSKGSGHMDVSGLSLEGWASLFPTFTIRDFELRKNSNYTRAGNKFNLGIPTFNNPVVTVNNGINLSGNMTVLGSAEPTKYFQDSGYLLVKNNSGAFVGTTSVLQYTGKTATGFTGVTLIRGQSFPTNGDEMVPFTID